MSGIFAWDLFSAINRPGGTTDSAGRACCFFCRLYGRLTVERQMSEARSWVSCTTSSNLDACCDDILWTVDMISTKVI